MVTTNGILSGNAYYESTVQQKKDNAVKAKNNASSRPVAKSAEDKLSTQAKSYLEKLRKQYGDYDFIIADAGDDRRKLLDKSDKEFSVILSSDELEKMASDENYANEKMDTVNRITNMLDRICKEFGYERSWGKENESDTIINKLAVSLNDDGSMSIFAELEKMTEKQKEYIEKLQDKRAEEKKAAEKSEEKKLNAYKNGQAFVKKVQLEASTEEEMIEKIANVDWNKVSGEKVGAKFDFSV